MSEDDPRVEMEVTITFKYKTDPFNYREGEPNRPTLAEMALIDREVFEDDISELIEAMEGEEVAITVKPVKND